jgi:hypothetical protein
VEGGLAICLVCNRMAEASEAAAAAKLVIECPGATLYDVESGQVLEGAKWLDPDDPTAGFEIVGRPVYAPNHTARRLIEAHQEGKITRCQACQDYTVRMRAQQRDHKSHGLSAARRRAENLFKKQ